MNYSSGPQPFWHQGPVSWKTIFPWTGEGGRCWCFRRLMRARASGRWSFACPTFAHLLLCSPVANRPRTGTGPRPRGWGPRNYSTKTPDYIIYKYSYWKISSNLECKKYSSTSIFLFLSTPSTSWAIRINCFLHMPPHPRCAPDSLVQLGQKLGCGRK